MPDAPTDLDILMSHVHEINAKTVAEVTDRDIDILVAYHRHNRARRLAGYKPAKVEKPKIDVLGLLNIKPSAPVPKQITGLIRRI
jgi:predicted nucleotidyltransferase